MKDNKLYETDNLTLAATLLTFGHDPKCKRKKYGNKVMFLFENSAGLAALVESFQKKEIRVEPTVFSDCKGELHGRINTLIN